MKSGRAANRTERVSLMTWALQVDSTTAMWSIGRVHRRCTRDHNPSSRTLASHGQRVKIAEGYFWPTAPGLLPGRELED